MRERGERLLATKQETADQLERDFRETEGKISAADAAHHTQFDTLLEESEASHQAALDKHAGEMEAIQKTFRESMTLRGPVEYWKAKADLHESRAAILMRTTFGSMALLSLAFGGLGFWAFSTFDQGKVAFLVLFAVLALWAIRLVVRMYLSQTHLATDAAERVTMVMTYLSLLEAQKMPSDEDRKLILTPLFRPATDGIVKDEGLPHPLLELLTRAGQK